jgi:hypothetical protein
MVAADETGRTADPSARCLAPGFGVALDRIGPPR